MNDRFLKACRREPVDRVPVWMMRQAGRYLPEYRDIRARHSFLEMCHTPEIAAEVTLQPVRRLGVDAAILFSDILVICPAMGVPVRFEEGRGPVLSRRVREPADIAALRIPDPAADLGFALDAIRLLRRKLAGEVPLIGFAGLPFTVASYLIEGGKSPDLAKTREMLARAPDAFAALLGKLAAATAAYVRAQVDAGAQAIQVFDSWAGVLDPADYERAVLPHTLKVLEGFPRDRAPVIHFATGSRRLISVLRRLPVDALSIDSELPLDEAAAVAGPGFALQGNLDPRLLLKPGPELDAAAAEVLRRGKAAGGHVFNLGHGVTPDASPEAVKSVVETVRRLSAKGGTGAA